MRGREREAEASRDADDLGRRPGVSGQFLSDPHETDSEDEKRGKLGRGLVCRFKRRKKEVTEREEGGKGVQTELRR